MNLEAAQKELARLRNRHVARLLTYLGDPQPYLESAIKKTMTQFADDVDKNILTNSDDSEKADGNNQN